MILKIFLATLLLIPAFAFGDIDPFIQDRMDMFGCSLNVACPGYSAPDLSAGSGYSDEDEPWAYMCDAKDSQGRVYSSYESESRSEARSQALEFCRSQSRHCAISKCRQY